MKRLIEIQSKLKANKGQFNKFGNYYYRSCEDILESVKPLLAEQGLALIISDDISQVGDRYYVTATAKLFDSKDGKLIAENHASAREEESKKGMDSSQVTGATSSYARKYCLNGLFAIDDTKDADTDAYTQQTKQTQSKATEQQTKQTQSKATEQQTKQTQSKAKKYTVRDLQLLIFQKGVNEEEVKEFYKVKSLDQMTGDDLYAACEHLLKKLDVIH